MSKIKKFFYKINFIKRYKELKAENEFLKKQLEIMSNNEIITATKKYSIDFVHNVKYIPKDLIDGINGIPTSDASIIAEQYKRECEKEILNRIIPLINYSRNDYLSAMHEGTIAFEMICPILVGKD